MNASITGYCVRLSPMKNSRNCWQTQKSMWTGWQPAALRAMILEEHPEATADRAIKVLEACQVEEEDFFCLVTHKTWDAILHDIRKAHEHEKDTDSAPEITPAQGLILSVRKAMQTPGDYIGKLTKIFCEAFGVSYKRLSEQEKETLQGIFKKARLVQNSRLSFRRRKK